MNYELDEEEFWSFDRLTQFEEYINNHQNVFRKPTLTDKFKYCCNGKYYFGSKSKRSIYDMETDTWKYTTNGYQ
jgi:hypothetical protein